MGANTAKRWAAHVPADDLSSTHGRCTAIAGTNEIAPGHIRPVDGMLVRSRTSSLASTAWERGKKVQCRSAFGVAQLRSSAELQPQPAHQGWQPVGDARSVNGALHLDQHANELLGVVRSIIATTSSLQRYTSEVRPIAVVHNNDLSRPRALEEP